MTALYLLFDVIQIKNIRSHQIRVDDVENQIGGEEQDGAEDGVLHHFFRARCIRGIAGREQIRKPGAEKLDKYRKTDQPNGKIIERGDELPKILAGIYRW